MSGGRITREWRGILMEKRGRFGKNGGVLRHALTMSNNGRRHKNPFPKVVIFGGEEEGEVPRIRSLDLEQKELEKSAFGRRKMRG